MTKGRRMRKVRHFAVSNGRFDFDLAREVPQARPKDHSNERSFAPAMANESGCSLNLRNEVLHRRYFVKETLPPDEDKITSPAVPLKKSWQ
jgi:hypothetical protein